MQEYNHRLIFADIFKTDGRKVICIGVNYSSAERNIDRWIID